MYKGVRDACKKWCKVLNTHTSKRCLEIFLLTLFISTQAFSLGGIGGGRSAKARNNNGVQAVNAYICANLDCESSNVKIVEKCANKAHMEHGICQCDDGCIGDGSTCVDKICPAGQKPDSDNSACINCEAGQVCPTCTDSTVPNGDGNGHCVCSENSCGNNYYCENGVCQEDQCVGIDTICVMCDSKTGTITNKPDYLSVCSNQNDKNGYCVSGICQANSCFSNDDCASGQYCKYGGYYNSNETRNVVAVNGSTASGQGGYQGVCTELGDSTTGTITGYLKSSSTMNWWSAKNWCAAQNKDLMDFSGNQLKCYSGTTAFKYPSSYGDCYQKGSSTLSTPMTNLQSDFGTSGYMWMDTDYNSYDAYYVCLEGWVSAGFREEYADWISALCVGNESECTADQHWCINGIHAYSCQEDCCEGVDTSCASCNSATGELTQNTTDYFSVCTNKNGKYGYCNGGTCQADSCFSNGDCASGQYCKYSTYYGSNTTRNVVTPSGTTATGTGAYKGVCTAFGGSSTTGAKTGYLRSLDAMNWWSAKNWCEAQKKELVNISNNALQCYNGTTAFTCSSSGHCCASGGSGERCTRSTPMQNIQSDFGPGVRYLWTDTNCGGSYYVVPSTGLIEFNAYRNYVKSGGFFYAWCE